MLELTTVDELEMLLRKEHRYWTDQAVSQHAAELHEELDSRFDAPVHACATRGEKSNLTVGDLSITTIFSYRMDLGYLGAIELLNTYEKNPGFGLSLLHRRMGR